MEHFINILYFDEIIFGNLLEKKWYHSNCDISFYSNFVDTPEEKDSMYLETDILPSLAGTDQVKIYFCLFK